MRPFALIALLLLASPARARDPAPPARPRLFLDCAETACELDYLRREIPFVDWVRDRADATVHALVTWRFTGAGGAQVEVCLLRPRGGPPADTLRFFLERDSTDDNVRRALARALKAGLARDLVGTPDGERLEISVPPAPAAAPGAAPAPPSGAPDPWKGWVFRAGASGSFSGEKAYRSDYLSDYLQASRVGERLKWALGGSHSYSESRYRFSEGGGLTVVNRSWGATARAALSIAPRWSAGAQAWASSATFDNVELSAGAGPALEFDVWPYTESSRRTLTLAWQLTGRRVDYYEPTLYGRMSETLWRHALIAELTQTQPWGSVDVTLDAHQYLHDADRYRVTAYASLSVRVVRGLALNLSGSWSRIHDQLSLPAGDATPEEILARQRLIATSYSWSTSVGLRYTFGSAVNNVVNPRMEAVYGGF